MTFQRRACAKRYDRHAVLGGDANDLGYVGSRACKDNSIRGLVREPGCGVAVLLADRHAGLKLLAEALFQYGNSRADCFCLCRRMCRFRHGRQTDL